MAVHFLHIRKAGGTAITHALRQAAKRSGGTARTPYGEVVNHPHSFRLVDVEPGDFAVLSVRDPVSRYVSGFYSRLRKGAPRYNREWSDRERKAFGWFETPQALAEALASKRGRQRERAEFAMNSIRHLRRHLVWWTGEPEEFRTRLPQVLYIARQETLGDDWQNLKVLLELPPSLELPSDPVVAHRSTGPEDRTLTPKMAAAVRDWYAQDYRLLEVCEEYRAHLIPRIQQRAQSPGGARP